LLLFILAFLVISPAKEAPNSIKARYTFASDWLKPNFWSAIRDLQAEKKLKQIMDRETIIKDFVEKIECLH